MKRNWLLLLSLLLIIPFTTYAAVSSNSDKTISGCVDKKTGVLRIAVNCQTRETQLFWNQKGVNGDAGLNGKDGLVGQQGPQGQQGPVGQQGPQGQQGPVGQQGPQGASNRLVVLDANFTLIGYPLGVGTGSNNNSVIGITTPWNFVTLWMPSLNNIIDLNFDGTPRLVPFHFTTSDCSGTPMQFFLDAFSDTYGKRAGRFSAAGPVKWFSPSSIIRTGSGTFLSDGGEGDCHVAAPFTVDYSINPQVTWQLTSSPLSGITIKGPLRFTVQ